MHVKNWIKFNNILLTNIDKKMKNDSSEKKINNIWGGRFSSSTDGIMEEFNSSIQFDKILYIRRHRRIS
jgi:hypothetical protein